MENLARHRAGELNDAEMGMANLKNAMGDPNMMKGIAEMMKDPNTMAEVQKMMSDPAFKAQAQRAMQDMQASGGFDFAKMGEAMAGMMGGGAMSAEIEKLRAENAMLKNRMRQEL